MLSLSSTRQLLPGTHDMNEEQRSDELWMEEALREAKRAQAAGEVPVGAVVVCEGNGNAARVPQSGRNSALSG